jgi:uncharacterized membrane protein YfcA
MTEEEIKKYWRMSADHEEIHINQSTLIMNLTNEIRDIDRKVRGRDMLELAAAAVVAIFFSVRFYLTTNIQTKVGCGILVLGCIITACKLLAAHNRRTGKQEDQSARTYLIHARKKVQNQIKLLNSVLYWYLLPLYLGLVIDTTATTGGRWFGIVFIPFLTYLYYKIYQLNNKAALGLYPVLERLDEALQQLEDS